MDHSELLAVAADWSFWDHSPPASVPRQLQLPTALRAGIALVVQGVRRCGKSTLLAQLMTRYGLDRSNCLFVNFEDPRLAAHLDHQTLQGLVDAFEASRGPGACYFFDEVQLVDGWQKWLRSQLDRSAHRRFVVTGSNAHLLAGELAIALTGRNHVVELFPFDFAEYRVARPTGTIEQFLHDGGFPAAAGAPDSDLLLRTYFNDIVERDVRERVGARSVQPLRQVVQMLFEAAGSELSVRRTAAAVGVAIETAKLYIEAAGNAYLVLPCPFFTWSARQRAVRNSKYYPVDTGLRRAVVTRLGEDRGKQLEAATFLALRQRFGEVAYWRDRGEVDFVVRRGAEVIPVQVSWDGPQERHHRALDHFYAAHPTASEAVFVTAQALANGLPELPAAT